MEKKKLMGGGPVFFSSGVVRRQRVLIKNLMLLLVARQFSGRLVQLNSFYDFVEVLDFPVKVFLRVRARLASFIFLVYQMEQGSLSGLLFQLTWAHRNWEGPVCFFVQNGLRLWQSLIPIFGSLGLVGWRRAAVIGFFSKARLKTRYNYRRWAQYLERRQGRRWRIFVIHRQSRFLFKRYTKLRELRYRLSFNYFFRATRRLRRVGFKALLFSPAGSFLYSFAFWRRVFLKVGRQGQATGWSARQFRARWYRARVVRFRRVSFVPNQGSLGNQARTALVTDRRRGVIGFYPMSRRKMRLSKIKTRRRYFFYSKALDVQLVRLSVKRFKRYFVLRQSRFFQHRLRKQQLGPVPASLFWLPPNAWPFRYRGGLTRQNRWAQAWRRFRAFRKRGHLMVEPDKSKLGRQAVAYYIWNSTTQRPYYMRYLYPLGKRLVRNLFVTSGIRRLYRTLASQLKASGVWGVTRRRWGGQRFFHASRRRFRQTLLFRRRRRLRQFRRRRQALYFRLGKLGRRLLVATGDEKKAGSVIVRPRKFFRQWRSLRVRQIGLIRHLRALQRMGLHGRRLKVRRYRQRFQVLEKKRGPASVLRQGFLMRVQHLRRPHQRRGRFLFLMRRFWRTLRRRRHVLRLLSRSQGVWHRALGRSRRSRYRRVLRLDWLRRLRAETSAPVRRPTRRPPWRPSGRFWFRTRRQRLLRNRRRRLRQLRANRRRFPDYYRPLTDCEKQGRHLLWIRRIPRRRRLTRKLRRLKRRYRRRVSVLTGQSIKKLLSSLKRLPRTRSRQRRLKRQRGGWLIPTFRPKLRKRNRGVKRLGGRWRVPVRRRRANLKNVRLRALLPRLLAVIRQQQQILHGAYIPQGQLNMRQHYQRLLQARHLSWKEKTLPGTESLIGYGIRRFLGAFTGIRRKWLLSLCVAKAKRVAFYYQERQLLMPGPLVLRRVGDLRQAARRSGLFPVRFHQVARAGAYRQRFFRRYRTNYYSRRHGEVAESSACFSQVAEVGLRSSSHAWFCRRSRRFRRRVAVMVGNRKVRRKESFYSVLYRSRRFLFLRLKQRIFLKYFFLRTQLRMKKGLWSRSIKSSGVRRFIVRIWGASAGHVLTHNPQRRGSQYLVRKTFISRGTNVRSQDRIIRALKQARRYYRSSTVFRARFTAGGQNQLRRARLARLRQSRRLKPVFWAGLLRGGRSRRRIRLQHLVRRRLRRVFFSVLLRTLGVWNGKRVGAGGTARPASFQFLGYMRGRHAFYCRRYLVDSSRVLPLGRVVDRRGVLMTRRGYDSNVGRYFCQRGFRQLRLHFWLTRRYPSVVDFESFNYLFRIAYFYKKFIQKGFRNRSSGIVVSVLRYLKPYSRFHLIRFVEQFLTEGFPLYFEMSSLKQSNREQPFPVPVNLRYFRSFMLKKLVTRFRAKQHRVSAQAALLMELWSWHVDPTLSVLHDFLVNQYAVGLDSRFFVHYRWRVKR